MKRFHLDGARHIFDEETPTLASFKVKSYENLLLNFKVTLVRAKVYQPTNEQAEKGTFKCNGRRSCQICALIVEGETFRNFNDSRSFTISSGAYHCNSENVVY